MREWKTLKEYDEILFEQHGKVAKITINRPEVHNAFTPKTVFEMIDAFSISRDEPGIGVIILTGAGDKAFCSGGDQKSVDTVAMLGRSGSSLKRIGSATLDSHVTKTGDRHGQRLVDRRRKCLQLVCDLTIAADNAKFGQTGPNVGSFDGGYGSGYLARTIGHKKPRKFGS